MVQLVLQRYTEQREKWPRSGRHLLAQFDNVSVVVYQAYRPAIGQFAVEHGHFGGEFSIARMSWVKPSFLWMMARSAWGTKPGQEKVLAVRLKRSAFDEILTRATPADSPGAMPEPEQKTGPSLRKPSVIVQWDPDRDPLGNKLERRTIQVGLRGDALKLYARDWLEGIEDITDLCREGRDFIESDDLTRLSTPVEDLYPVKDPEVRRRLGLS